MLLFIAGFATGTLMTIYMFLGTSRWQGLNARDAVWEQAEKWKHQRPLPPF